MPTNTDAPRERIISDFNRDLFGKVYFILDVPDDAIRTVRTFKVNDEGDHKVSCLTFDDTDAIRRFAADLITEANRFDASGA